MTRPLLGIVLILCCLSSCVQKQKTEISESNNHQLNVTEENHKYESLNLEELLTELSKKAIELGDFQFDTLRKNWIGNESVSESEITAAENRLEVELPSEYKEFLRLTNGFPAVNQIEPSFLRVSKIDYTRNIDPFLISIWGTNGIQPDKDLGAKYERSILIGGIEEEQMFMIIPPENEGSEWEYWKFANWIPGQEVYISLRAYFESALEFCSTAGSEN